MNQKNKGDKIPATALTIMGGATPEKFSLLEESRGKRILVVVAPGGFTPTCSNDHVPPYIKMADQFKQKGMDAIYCLSTNDIFVLTAWQRELGGEKAITMVSDGNGEFTKEMGMTLDLTSFGMGMRSRRYAMVVQDGIIEALFAEEGAGLEHSKAEIVMAGV